MFTDTKKVVSILLIVLFLSMILANPSVFDVSYFCFLFTFCIELLL